MNFKHDQAQEEFCKKGILGKIEAFSLIEILVASAVLAILLLVVAGLMNNTVDLTKISNRRSYADGEARQALDRFSTDLHTAILRSDLPQRIIKEQGNDSLTFYAQRDGYEGDRGVSRISYGVLTNMLVRGSDGTSWESNAVAFGGTNLSAVSDMESEMMASGIFRLEIAFLMRDGKIKESVTNLVSSIPSQDVKAIVVGVIALDPEVRKKMTGSMDDLGAHFRDAVDGDPANNIDIANRWNEDLATVDPAQYPAAVRGAIRIYQRYCFLER